MTTHMNIEEWMSQNKLSGDVCMKLKEREVTMEELLEFDDDELRSFCDDMEFNSVQKVRLLKAVKLFGTISNKNNEEKKEEKEENKYDECKTVFISEEENKQFEILCNHQQKANKLIENIKNGYKTLDTGCDNTINYINDYFDEFIYELEKKQKHLLINIDTIYKYKSIGFKQQLAQSSKYFTHITKMKDDFEYFANNSSMNQRRRMIKLQSMLHEIMNTNVAMRAIYSPYIGVTDKNMNEIYNYFNTLQISYCDTPAIPNININDSYFENNTFSIRWNMQEIGEFEADITGFQLYYSKINVHKRNKIKYYDDFGYDDNFITNILLKIVYCGKYILNQLKKLFLPSFLRKDNKGKIIFINENDNITEMLSKIGPKQWIKSELIAANKREYKIKDLEYNGKYVIKLRSSNKNGWSDFCEVIMIETPALKLTWKYGKKSHKHFNLLTDSRMMIESSKYGGMYRLFGENVISKKSLQNMNSNENRFCFEFIVHKMSYSNYGTSIGFIAYPFDNSNKKQLGTKSTDFCISMHFGINTIQIKCNGSATNYGLYIWPWHKTRNGDSFIFDMDLQHNNHIDVYHNGVHLPLIFQQLHNQGRKIVIPKKFILSASICHDRPITNYNNYNYLYTRKKKYKKHKKKHIVGDVEINYLDKNDMLKYRMILRSIWYVFIPWFIRVNFKFIVFILIIAYYMTKYRYILSWNTTL